MSKKEKVTIKFWDKVGNLYVHNPDDYVTGDGDFECWWWCDLRDEYIYDENITAHFYIGDKRIG